MAGDARDRPGERTSPRGVTAAARPPPGAGGSTFRSACLPAGTACGARPSTLPATVSVRPGWTCGSV